MMKLAFGALLVGLLVACGGGGDSKKVVIVDSGGTVDTPMQCNPLTQAGCAAGEKCTWLLDALMPQYVGHIGCAPDGSAAAGDSCMYGEPGATGYDNCAKGNVCGNYRGGTGTCKQICDQQGGMPACANTHVCVTYSGLFSTGDTTPAAGGVCDLACDPLTDNDFDGSGSAAQGKTTMTCGTNAMVGCYGYPSFGTPPKTGWSCTNDINYAATGTGLRHRVQCTEANECADAGPTIYVNSCNQGYLPLLRESSMVTTAVCIALCKPATCYENNCGANNIARQGVSDGTGRHACKTGDRVGNFDAQQNPTQNGVETGGEHCTHLWYFEIDDQDNFLESATSDTVGFCYNHAKYQYDSDSNGMLTSTDLYLPTCGRLGSASSTSMDRTMPYTFFGAPDLGCTPSSFLAAQGKSQLPSTIAEKRKLVDLPRSLYRRTMNAVARQ